MVRHRARAVRCLPGNSRLGEHSRFRLEDAQIRQIYDGAEMDAELAAQTAAYRPPGS